MINRKPSKVPPEVIDLIIDFVKNHNLGPVNLLGDPEADKILGNVKNPDEILKKVENLPFERIYQIVKKFIQEEIKDLAFSLQKEVKIPKDLALDLATQIESTLKITSPEVKSYPTYHKKELSEELSEKKKREDIYREPIE